MPRPRLKKQRSRPRCTYDSKSSITLPYPPSPLPSCSYHANPKHHRPHAFIHHYRDPQQEAAKKEAAKAKAKADKAKDKAKVCPISLSSPHHPPHPALSPYPLSPTLSRPLPKRQQRARARLTEAEAKASKKRHGVCRAQMARSTTMCRWGNKIVTVGGRRAHVAG